MANKYSANPKDAKNFTQSSEIKLKQDIQDYSEFLPAVNRTESIQRFFGATVNQLLSSGSTQSVDAYWGRITGRNYNPERETFNPEHTDTRANYQFQPGTIRKENGDVSSATSYINWIDRLTGIGADVSNHDRIFSEPGYTLDLPINHDMFINYNNYYWLEGDIPLIVIHPISDNPIDIDTIVGLGSYTTPVLRNLKTVKFVTGIRIRFAGSSVTSTTGDYAKGAIYSVENVGGRGGIRLVELTDVNGVNKFSKITPYYIQPLEGWDTSAAGWDTGSWNKAGEFSDYDVSTTETRDDLSLNKTYIVMERWASDKNPWARTNSWFSIYALQIATAYNELELEAYLNYRTRAIRPIIQWNANIELYATGKRYVETIDYTLSAEQVTTILSGTADFAVDDDNYVQNGDIVLVTSGTTAVSYIGPFGSAFSGAFSLGYNSSTDSRAFTVSGVGTNIVLTEHATYSDDDYVIVGKGISKGHVWHYKDGVWTQSQSKSNRGSFPLFNLYNDDGVGIDTLADTDFKGDPIFAYRVSDMAPIDRELGIRPVFTNQGSFNNYRYDFTLGNIRYRQSVSDDNIQRIDGFYAYKDSVREELHTGWSNIRGGQRVPIISTQIADGASAPTFNLGTTDLNHTTAFTASLEDGNVYWYENTTNDQISVGSSNPTLLWRKATTYTVTNLVTPVTAALQFRDPYGNADANIVVSTASDTEFTVNVGAGYTYDKITYHCADDVTVTGEIHLTESNHSRASVSLNGVSLEPSTDYNISSSTLTVTADTIKNDVIELSYITDAELTGVAYDVAPVHFYNSDNEPFEGAGYDALITHMSRQMVAMPGFTGDPLGANNYHNTVHLHQYDGLIRQQRYSTKRVQHLVDQHVYSPASALKTLATDYENFKTYFRNKTLQLWKTGGQWPSVRALTDQAMAEINLGKDETFKYAHSDMCYYRQSVDITHSISDATVIFELPSANVVNHYDNTRNHVDVWLKEDRGASVYHTRPLILGTDYDIVERNVVLANTVNLNAGLDPATLTIRWYDHTELSHVPFSAVKLGFQSPTTVEIADGVLIGHDGSRHTLTGTDIEDMSSVQFDVVAACLYDFELRVSNNLVAAHRPDTTIPESINTWYPSPNRTHAYDITDLESRLDDWINRWAHRNEITEFNTVAYDAANEFTWNYNSVSPHIAGWRGLYVYYFGTDRPHTHPWEMLGHNEKPSWWDATYSWTAGALRVALIEALKKGKTGNGTTSEFIDIRYARHAFDWSVDLVSDDGNNTLIGPVTAGVVSVPSMIARAIDFVSGDWGSVENEWRKSSEYPFALMETYLQLKPYRTFDTFWKLSHTARSRLFAEEQWYNTDTLSRVQITDIHNRLTTTNTLDYVRVISPGTGYTSLSFVFDQDIIPGHTPSIEATLTAGAVSSLSVTNPGRDIDIDKLRVVANDGASGFTYEVILNQTYVPTILGLNAAVAEQWRTGNTDSAALANELDNLTVAYMVHTGGFTDKRIMNLEIDGDYSSGLVRVPESNYQIKIDVNSPLKTVFYSGVKVTKTSNGYSVSGYDLDTARFSYLQPSTGGRAINVEVGSINVVRHLNWHNELYTIPYNTVFSRRQDLYQFLLGLGEYYETLGFETRTKWQEDAAAIMAWTLSAGTDSMHVNGISDSITYAHGARGTVQHIDVNHGGDRNVLDSSGNLIRQKELLVLRTDDNTVIQLKDETNRIYGIRLNVIEYEHIIIIDNVTTFNDPIYQPEIGLGKNRIRLIGERTRNWKGRVEATGHLVQDNGIMLNMESSVRELETDWISSDAKVLERLTRQTMGHNVGWVKPTYMTNTYVSDRAAYRYEQGRRKYAGTTSAISAMGRNKNIFGEEFDTNVYEEWMVRLGEYGDRSEHSPIEIGVTIDRLKTDPQHFRFNDTFTSDNKSDLIIDIHKGSNSAISGNFDSPFELYPVLPINNTSISALDSFQSHIRDAGLPLVDEVDYFLDSIDNVSDIYDPTQDYALVPNWSATTAYTQGDIVRLDGKVYRLQISATGITNVQDDIIVRGNQIFPTTPNGTTLVFNGQNVTFSKSDTSVAYNPIVLTGTITNPAPASGSTLVIDNTNVNFIKTSTEIEFSDIVLNGNVSFPAVQNSATRAFTVSYADSTSPTPLTDVTVTFNELATTMGIRDIISNALETALGGILFSNAATIEAGNRLSALESLRAAYIDANSTAAWETWISNYFDGTTTPNHFLNPAYLGAQVNANTGAAWESQARALIQLDLDLINDLTGAIADHSETEATMVSGVFNNTATFNTARNAANNLLDNTVTANNDNENLEDLISWIETNGATAISAGTQVTVANPIGYVVDDLAAIATKIEAALASASAPANIVVSTTNDVLVITRNNTSEGHRLGVSTDNDLGFTPADNDTQTSGTTTTVPVNLTLANAVDAVNNAAISGVAATAENDRLVITSINTSISISSGSANTAVGLIQGVTNATFTSTAVPGELSIGDVVTQINSASIANLTANQIDGALIISFVGSELVIGDGTANADIGIIEGTYESRTDTVQNAFNQNDWVLEQEPADFSVWTIDNVGSNPTSSLARSSRYDVLKTVDHNIGVTEICAGVEYGNNALIWTNLEQHNISVNEYVLIINSTCVPSADGIHRVTALQGTTGFYIDFFIEQKGAAGKVIPLRSVRFANSDVANTIVHDPKYISAGLGLRSGSHVYVDDVLVDTASQGYGAVYTIVRSSTDIGLSLLRNENGKTNNSKIKNGILYSNTTGDTITRHEVFDPLKGIIPGIADKELDLKSDSDLARYTATTDPSQEISSESSWGQERVGTTWWDLSRAVYLNYDQSTPGYRQAHWGELFPTSSIVVYEWTKSPVTPDEYDAAVSAGAVVDGIELTGIPYATIDQFGEEQYYWSEEVEINSNSNQLETFYYFWARNKTTTPTLERDLSVLQIQDIISDPSIQNVDWLAATSANTMLVTTLTDARGYDDLVMQVNFNRNEVDHHQEFLMLAENDPRTHIPEWLHLSLRDSLVGYASCGETLDWNDWDAAISYTPDSVVSYNGKFYRAHTATLGDIPTSTTQYESYWSELEVQDVNPDGIYQGQNTATISKTTPIPSRDLHPYSRYGIETRPQQTWFKSNLSARKSAIRKVNSQFKKINVIDSPLPWQEELEKTLLVGNVSYDLIDYWNFVDWSADGFVYMKGAADYFVERQEDMATISAVEGQVVHIEISTDIDGRNRRQAYKRVNDSWELVYKEKATIEFSDLFYNSFQRDFGWDVSGWDVRAWDKSSAAVVSELFSMLYHKFWVNTYNQNYTDLWFHMVKYAHQDHSEIDWIFKSSYITLDAKDNLEKKWNKYFTDKAEDFFDYVDMVKPFRTKIRESTVGKQAMDNMSVQLQDTAEIRVQTNPVDENVDGTDTRSFRLSVGNTENNFSSQIVDEYKGTLGTDISAESTVIYINNSILPSGPGAAWINGERIEYSSVVASTEPSMELVFDGSSDSFIITTVDVAQIMYVTARGTHGTFARKHFTDETVEYEFALVENQQLNTWANGLPLAWQDYGTGLLDAINTQPNGVTIKTAGRFGTI